ncbi:MAG: uracil-xanthine permease family protein [Fusobacterium sp.]|uniref:uracil-xanthine permease family protein n=1 Tax=Fusobacterium sp. SB021 TaxID=2744227 RepID=UPI001D81F551|nr:uracil-xanthine permease [Fusobacterium sp.]
MTEITTKGKLILGLQHVLAMFGATVLVPFLTGMNPSIALLTAGVGTLLFHTCTKGIVPVFLGSSFAFIGAISLVLRESGVGAVKGGVIAAGVVYIVMSRLVKIYGVEKIKSFFPPVVVGPTIVVIGLRLSPTALSMAGYSNGHFDGKSLIVSGIVVLSMIGISILGKSFFKLVPILISVILGYIVSIFLGMVDFTPIKEAGWIGLSSDALYSLVTVPEFSLTSILAIAPIALVVFIEHIGDITTNGAVVGKDFFANPGISRTLLGDGLATVVAGFLGGPANTTYGENTGVLAVTKVYDPSILRIAACYAIGLAFIGKFGVILQTIPAPVMGGISVILFGMIASVGMRTLIEAQLDFSHSRNLIISSLILVFGIGIDNIVVWRTVSLSGLAIAALIGVILNKIFPENI